MVLGTDSRLDGPRSLSAPKDATEKVSSAASETTVTCGIHVNAEEAVAPKKSWRFWVAFIVLLLCAFLSSIDATILATALPTIAQELNGSSILAFWCGTAYLLAKTVLQPGISYSQARR
jgi:hypothetical protein